MISDYFIIDLSDLSSWTGKKTLFLKHHKALFY